MGETYTAYCDGCKKIFHINEQYFDVETKAHPIGAWETLRSKVPKYRDFDLCIDCYRKVVKYIDELKDENHQKQAQT